MKPVLCYIGIHIYKDHFVIGKPDGWELPFMTTEKCKCGKIRNSATGFVALPTSDIKKINEGLMKGDKDE